MSPSPEPSVQANDILVDGFIARTFSARDARIYFMGFFRTPDSLQDYRISYSRGAWRITENQNQSFMRWPLSRALSQDSPQPLDFDVRATQGTVVPQRRRTPVDHVEWRRYTENCALQLPIFFVHRDGGIGFLLSDILQGCDSGLFNGDSEAPLGPYTTTSISINWPCYADWTRHIPLRDMTCARNLITLSRFMKLVGRSVDRFLDASIQVPFTNDNWRIGSGGITQNDVKIIGVVHVSFRRWMPIIQVTRHIL